MLDMGKTLTQIAEDLKRTPKKVQLIYAFNGVGKTRLSCEFKELVAPKTEGEEAEEGHAKPFESSCRNHNNFI